MRDWIIEKGDVLGPEGLEKRDLFVAEGRIAEKTADDARVVSAEGCWVLPGIVDVHGDAFERVMSPRPNVTFDLPIALRDADRQLIANGITTAFHGVTASWEPGLRSFAGARRFLDALEAMRADLDCDTHVNLRWEVYELDHLEELIGWLVTHPSLLLSLNDHLSVYRALDAESLKIARMSDRCGVSRQDCLALVHRLWERSGEVPEAIRAVTESAVAAGRVVFAHDETSPTLRAQNRALGVSVSEFPMSLSTAQAAIDAQEAVVLGAPNVLRGGSQNKAVDAQPAIASGLCTALASDYYYPAPFLAGFALVDRDVLDLAAAWDLVSAGPARAAGLTDRGILAPEHRADILLVERDTRLLRAVFVAGRKVFARE